MSAPLGLEALGRGAPLMFALTTAPPGSGPMLTTQGSATRSLLLNERINKQVTTSDPGGSELLFTELW